MKIVQEFKEFVARGNVVDLAVAVLIGAAFGSVVKSFASDLMTPIIAKVSGGADAMNFNNYFIPLDGKFDAYSTLEKAQAQTAVFAYGSFLTVLIQFLITALCVFALMKAINAFNRKEAAAPSTTPSKTETLLSEIRDLLAKK